MGESMVLVLGRRGTLPCGRCGRSGGLPSVSSYGSWKLSLKTMPCRLFTPPGTERGELGCELIFLTKGGAAASIDPGPSDGSGVTARIVPPGLARFVLNAALKRGTRP